MASSNIGFKKRFTFILLLLSLRSVLMIRDHQGVLLYHILRHLLCYNQGVVCHLFWKLQMQPDRQIKLRLNWTGKGIKKRAIRGGPWWQVEEEEAGETKRRSIALKVLSFIYQCLQRTVRTQWVLMTKRAYKTIYCNFSLHNNHHLPRTTLFPSRYTSSNSLLSRGCNWIVA